MYDFHELTGFIYVGDFLFFAAQATMIIKLKLDKSSQGFSAKTQGVYGVVLCTRNIDLFFVEGSTLFLIYFKIIEKIANISCIIYIVFKIKTASKNNAQCSCNQDSFWVEALVLPCIIITAVFHYGSSPEEVLWSFSTYLETVAMVPQFYLTQVRGKGDSYLPAYITLMALYTLMDALAFGLNTYLYDQMKGIWFVCKILQLLLYIWYIVIPREAVLPVANCHERKRKATIFVKQQSMLAVSLLKKNNTTNDLQIFSVTANYSAPSSECSTPIKESLETSSNFYIGDSPRSHCLKFSPFFEPETINIKPPCLTMRQLKHKGTLKINQSLPGTPKSLRKYGLERSISSVSFKPTQDLNVHPNGIDTKQDNTSNSLPVTPESLRKTEEQRTFDMSQSELHQKTRIKQNKKPQFLRTDLLKPPEKKRELILRVHPLVNSYRSLSHLPTTHDYQPNLPDLKISLPTNNKEPVAISNEHDLSLTASSSNPSTSTQNRHILPEHCTSASESSNTVTAKKPKRPPLPKFILNQPEEVKETERL